MDNDKLLQLINLTGVCEVFERERFLIQFSKITIEKERIYFELEIKSKTHQQFIRFADEEDNSAWEFVNAPPCGGTKEFSLWVELNLPPKKGYFSESVHVFGNNKEDFVLVLSKQVGFAMRIFYDDKNISEFKKLASKQTKSKNKQK